MCLSRGREAWGFSFCMVLWHRNERTCARLWGGWRRQVTPTKWCRIRLKDPCCRQFRELNACLPSVTISGSLLAEEQRPNDKDGCGRHRSTWWKASLTNQALPRDLVRRRLSGLWLRFNCGQSTLSANQQEKSSQADSEASGTTKGGRSSGSPLPRRPIGARRPFR